MRDVVCMTKNDSIDGHRKTFQALYSKYTNFQKGLSRSEAENSGPFLEATDLRLSEPSKRSHHLS
jgi:hypothetical protein